MPSSLRRLAAALALVLPLWLGLTAAARAASTMQSMFQDDPHLMADPAGTLEQMRLAGATVVKVAMRWDQVAPNPRQRKAPRGFNASDPRSYPGRNWQVYDEIVRDAVADGMTVNFDLGEGAPIWATGLGAPRNKPYWNWEPSASAFGQFVRAVATSLQRPLHPQGRQSTPLPRITNWSVWSEPNLGYSLAPQAVPGHPGVQNSSRMYRSLRGRRVDALHQTGHGGDTILIGDLGPRGGIQFGMFNSMRPLIFVEALYCVDSSFRPFARIRRHRARLLRHRIRGTLPRAESGAVPGLGDRRFTCGRAGTAQPRSPARPDLRGLPGPRRTSSGRSTRSLRAYRSPKRLNFYNTEFGYITNPPEPLGAVRLADHRALLPQLGRVHLLAQPADEAASPSSSSATWLRPRRALQVLVGRAAHLHRPTEGDLQRLADAPVPARNLDHEWAHPRGLGLRAPGAVRDRDTGEPQRARSSSPPPDRVLHALGTVTLTGRASCYFDLRLKFPSSGTVRLSLAVPDRAIRCSPPPTRRTDSAVTAAGRSRWPDALK